MIFLGGEAQWETFGLHVEIAQMFKMCTYYVVQFVSKIDKLLPGSILYF